MNHAPCRVGDERAMCLNSAAAMRRKKIALAIFRARKDPAELKSRSRG